MARKPISTGTILTVGFLLFTFASGFVIMFASKKNTEDRSRASGPYNSENICAAACEDITGGTSSIACLKCLERHPSPKVSPTPHAGNPWDECVEWTDATFEHCSRTYRQLKSDKDKDWRCKALTIGYGLCPQEYNFEMPPGNP